MKLFYCLRGTWRVLKNELIDAYNFYVNEGR